MKKYKGIVMVVGMSALLVFGAVFENSIAMNLFTAMTIFVFFMMLLVAFAFTVIPEEPKVHETIAWLAHQKSSLPEKAIGRTCQFINLGILFGLGFWIKGFMWFIIYFVVYAYIKRAVSVYNNGVKRTFARPSEFSNN